jgi:cell division protein FtsI (penicillin-binding protein 3)
MERKPQTTARYYFLLSFFAIMGLLLLWRIIDLTILDRTFLRRQGDARSIRTLSMPAYRGMISDRNGVPLAVSTPVKSVWANPLEFAPSEKQLTSLATYLKTSPKAIKERIDSANNKEFVYLSRHIAPHLAASIKVLNIPGINFQQEFRRYYPDGENTAHLIGFTNIDDIGLEGLELAYDDWLKGVAGKKRVLKDRLGHIIEEVGVIHPPRSGRNIALSIDRRIQYLALRELKQTIKKYAAKSGSVIVLDVTTGELLAAVNYPTFNPNSRARRNDGSYRNRAFTDVFEPGSVIKAFSVASAVKSGKFAKDSLIDTRPSWMRIGNKMIHDMRNYGIINLTEILQRSSNVGVSKLILSNPANVYLDFLREVGFGERTTTGFPGEASGLINDVGDNQAFVLATLSFGYGLSVTPLQLAKAYMVFATGGKLYPVTLLRTANPVSEKQVLTPEQANEVLSMLEAVVEKGGTGRRGQVKGYRVAGKTGTSRIASDKGYDKNRHVASFAGIAPVSSPRLVVVVVINEPTKQSYYGGVVAAPLFSSVMGGALRLLEIAPDDVRGDKHAT